VNLDLKVGYMQVLRYSLLEGTAYWKCGHNHVKFSPGVGMRNVYMYM